MRATAAPAVRPNLAVAAEARLALPSPRTTNAAQHRAARRPRGRGRGALPTGRSAEATSAPHLYVTGSASARSIHGPGRSPPRRRLSPPPLPAGHRGRFPPTGAPAAGSPTPWKDATRGGRKFISTANAPEALGERTAREVHALGRLSVEPNPPGRSPDHPDARGKGQPQRQV